MVSNQNEFNVKYKAKESKEIKITDEDYEGQLIIEDYSELEKLCLQEVDNIDKVILKNLNNLQECTIWDCGMKELVIENCPQIKKLIVRSNLLVNLEFTKDLKNLEELDLYGNIEINSGLEHLSSSLKTFSYENTKLVEILKPYKGNWDSWKAVQKLTELAQQNPQELAKKFWELQEENKELKENQPITLDPINFQKKYQKLKGVLNFLLKEEQLKSKEINLLKTEEITNTLGGKLKEQEKSLFNLQKSNQELQEKLSIYEAVRDKIHQKEQELVELKQNIINNNHLEEDDLDDVLEAQIDFFNSNDSKRLDRNKRRLAKLISEEGINNLCQLQETIIKLQININHREKQLIQITNNISGDINVQGGNVIIGNSISDHANFSYNSKLIELPGEELEAKIEMPL